MAKKPRAEVDRKKLVVPILLLLGGLLAGKIFFGSDAAKSAAEVAAEEAAAADALQAECAAANGIAIDDAPESDSTESDTTDSDSAATETTVGDDADASATQRELVDLTEIALVSATRPAQSDDEANVVPSVLEMESVTVNLADGYLKIGLALQLREGLTAEAADAEGMGARALDMALERLSAKTKAQLLPADTRSQLKRQLGMDVCLAYEGAIVTVYFTEFVMQ